MSTFLETFFIAFVGFLIGMITMGTISEPKYVIAKEAEGHRIHCESQLTRSEKCHMIYIADEKQPTIVR